MSPKREEQIAIGIDLGGTRLKGGIITRSGKVVREVMAPSRVQVGYETVLDDLVALTENLREIAKAELERLILAPAIGLGVAGLMEQSRKRVIAAPNCPAIVGQSLASDLGRRLSAHVVMDNDANVVAIAEGLCGAARGCQHYVAITIGTGIGGAIVVDGRLLRGTDGGGGEIGHIPISRYGPKCGCGSRGCLESYIGRASLDRYIEKHYPEFACKSLVELAHLAKGRNIKARDFYAYIGETLGVALTGLVNLFNPQCIVIGGGVSAAGELLLGPARREVERRAFATYLSSLKIRGAKLGNWAGVVGAAMMALDEGP
ncbi:MAG: ROK family protein [Calditrichaeota bacterium]|nr:ROK family protein [Calditrichota bacterium]